MEITTATQKKIDKEIKRRNRLFAKATNAKKRVLIAKDVIDQIKVGRFAPTAGSWYTLPDSLQHLHYDEPDVSLQTALLATAVADEYSEPCSGCALGGMFISCTLFNNNITVEHADTLNYGGRFDDLLASDNRSRSKFSNGLDKIFTPSQLRLIEYVFERRVHAIAGISDAADDEWRVEYRRDEPRLIAIMQNIIDNNGTFKPNDILKKKRATAVSRR